MNQLANESDLKITKGSVKTYTYQGDSGKSGANKEAIPHSCHL